MIISMNSYFMSQLIHTLSGNYPEIYLSEIDYMDSSSVQATAVIEIVKAPVETSK